MMVVQYSKCTKCLQIVHFQMVEMLILHHVNFTTIKKEG